MKNKKRSLIPILLAILISAFFTVTHIKPASAQDECRDAAGGVIPCAPPAKDPSSEGDNEGGKKNPTPVPPTKTPLAIVNPDNGATEGKKKDDWAHACVSGNGQLNCILAAAETCEADGGDSTGTTNSNGTVTITCTHLVIEPTPMPLTSSNDGATEGKKKDDWSHTCEKGSGQLDCILAAGETCQADGGDSTGSTNSNGSVTITCTHLVIDSTPMPITASTQDGDTRDWSGWCGNGDSKKACLKNYAAQCIDGGGDINTEEDSVGSGTFLVCTGAEAPGQTLSEPTDLKLVAVATATPLRDEGYLGQCTKADGDFFECQKKFTCEDGLLVMKVDLYTGNGTVYDFYCYPHKPNLSIAAIPDNGSTEDNWGGICGGNNAGDNLGNCLDIYAAACAQEGGDYSEWYDEDGSAGVYCQNESEANQSVPAETALPAAIPTDSGSTPPSSGIPWLWLTIGGVSGALLLPAIQKVRSAAARSHNSPAPTREHILLNKDNNGPKTGFEQPDDPSTAQYKLKDVMVSSIKPSEQDPK